MLILLVTLWNADSDVVLVVNPLVGSWMLMYTHTQSLIDYTHK